MQRCYLLNSPNPHSVSALFRKVNALCQHRVKNLPQKLCEIGEATGCGLRMYTALAPTLRHHLSTGTGSWAISSSSCILMTDRKSTEDDICGLGQKL